MDDLFITSFLSVQWVCGWMDDFLLSLFLECNQLMGEGDFLLFHLLEYIGNLDVMYLFE